MTQYEPPAPFADPRAVPVLVDALRDPVVETRIYALIALAELRDGRAVPAVIATTKDDEKDVRKTAFYALGELGDARAPSGARSQTFGHLPVFFLMHA